MALIFNGTPAVFPRNKAQDDGGSNNLLTNLTAYWSMDEASGTRADSTANGTDLTDNNTVGQGAAVIGSGTGNSADFESSNSESLTASSNSFVSFGNFDYTLNLWWQAESLSANQAIYNINSTVAAADRENFFAWLLSIADLQVGLYNSAGTLIANATSSTTWSTGTPYMLTVTHDASANDLIVYRNTTQIASSISYSGTPQTVSGATLGIGKFGADNSSYVDGLIDEVGYWKRILTSAEITDLYNSGNGRTYSYFE